MQSIARIVAGNCYEVRSTRTTIDIDEVVAKLQDLRPHVGSIGKVGTVSNESGALDQHQCVSASGFLCGCKQEPRRSSEIASSFKAPGTAKRFVNLGCSTDTTHVENLPGHQQLYGAGQPPRPLSH
jgi:hypothetical protein